MHFAGALELLGIPYTGAPPLALGLCRDKVKTKLILRGHGIPTAPFVLAESPDAPLDGTALPGHRQAAAEDGSLGITDASVAGDEGGARRAIAAVREQFGPVLVEEFIEGRELNVPVLGNAPPRVLPVSEIDFAGLAPGLPHICGYEAKWEQADARYAGTVGICPASLAAPILDRLEHWSALAFRSLGLRDYARIDWRLSPTRGLMALEANPNPDISPTSGFLRSVRAAGMDYQEFIGQLLEETLGAGLNDDAAHRRGDSRIRSAVPAPSVRWPPARRGSTCNSRRSGPSSGRNASPSPWRACASSPGRSRICGWRPWHRRSPRPLPAGRHCRR